MMRAGSCPMTFDPGSRNSPSSPPPGPADAGAACAPGRADGKAREGSGLVRDARECAGDPSSSCPTAACTEGRTVSQEAPLSEADRLRVLALFLADPILAMREVLPHWFPKKMPWVHRAVVALALERSDFLLNFASEKWRDEEAEWTIADLRKIEKHFTFKGHRLFHVTWVEGVPVKVDIIVSDKMIVVLPRGFSKTTLFKAVLILIILYMMEKVILYVSETGPHAAAQVNDIRMELQFNEKIAALWGKLAPERQDPQKWTDEEFETLSGIHVIARGRGGQVRGLNRASTRPGIILWDDLEDEESVSTEPQRHKVKKWFRGALERAGKLVGRTRLFGIGTILHHEALIPELAKDENYIVLEFGAVDLDNEALWAEAMDLEKLEATRQAYASTGDLGVFYREIMSKNVPDEDRKFRPDMIRVVPRQRKDLLAVGIACDPAISKKATASKCAFAVVGITPQGLIHVCEVYARIGMTPREQVDKFFELAMKWDCTRHGIETIAYQQALAFLLQEEMFRKGKVFGPKAYFEIESIKHSTDEAKHKRIEGVLQPRYAAGYVTHQASFPGLVTALTDWPNCKMDEPDAVAMAVTLLDEFAGLAGGDELNDDNRTPTLEHELEGLEFRTAP